MDVSLQSVADKDAFDVVVIGAGGAGMSAALFAAMDGARVLLVERTEYLGGTTALSAATSWVPLSEPGLAVDPSDSYEKALEFLRAKARVNFVDKIEEKSEDASALEGGDEKKAKKKSSAKKKEKDSAE